MPSEKISLLLPHDVLEHVRQAAAAGGETLNEFVHAALTDRLSRMVRLRLRPAGYAGGAPHVSGGGPLPSGHPAAPNPTAAR
jgi:hypothetical protein